MFKNRIEEINTKKKLLILFHNVSSEIRRTLLFMKTSKRYQILDTFLLSGSLSTKVMTAESMELVEGFGYQHNLSLR